MERAQPSEESHRDPHESFASLEVGGLRKDSVKSPPGAGGTDEWSIFSGRVTCWGRSLAGMKVGPNDQRKNRVWATRYSGLAELLENACESERIRISCWNVASTGGRRLRPSASVGRTADRKWQKPADSAAVLGMLPGPAILIDGSRHAGRWEEIG